MNQDQGNQNRPASDLAFTPAVKAIQQRLNSRKGYARMEQGQGWSQTVTPDLAQFIAERDSFYLGTVSSEGQPYIQHRGGKAGFLKVLDETTLGFAEYSGNKQYISMGNLVENNRAFIFLMDYANRRRVKLWGRAEFIEGDAELLNRLQDDDYHGRVERGFIFHIEVWDQNCPQHITPRFTQSQIDPMIQQLEERNESLEERIQVLEETISALAPAQP